jgi:hypothetical protein
MAEWIYSVATGRQPYTMTVSWEQPVVKASRAA